MLGVCVGARNSEQDSLLCHRLVLGSWNDRMRQKDVLGG